MPPHRLCHSDARLKRNTHHRPAAIPDWCGAVCSGGQVLVLCCSSTVLPCYTHHCLPLPAISATTALYAGALPAGALPYTIGKNPTTHRVFRHFCLTLPAAYSTLFHAHHSPLHITVLPQPLKSRRPRTRTGHTVPLPYHAPRT